MTLIRGASTVLALAATVLLPGVAVGQGNSGAIAYTGLVHTPVGMLPSVITPTMLGSAVTGASLQFDYATVARGRNNNKSTAFGATGMWSPSPRGTLSLTLGKYHEICPDPECSNKRMFGVGGDWRLASTRRGNDALASFMTVSVRGEAASGEQQFATRYVVLGASIPIAWTVPTTTGLLVSPYLDPGVAWTDVVSGNTFGGNDLPSGVCLRAGAGIDVRSRKEPFGFHLGANQAFASRARVVWGGGLTIQL